MLRDRKNRIRLVLFILAVLIAVGSFTTWAIKLVLQHEDIIEGGVEI